MNYEEMLSLSEKSDHKIRIVSELTPALKEALANTNSKYAFLEIGNRDGGSGGVIIYHINLEGKQRYFVTADINPCPNILEWWCEKLKIPHAHHSGSQEEFVKNNKTEFGFIFLDANHTEIEVKRDIRVLASFMVRGGVIVVDDIHEWVDGVLDFTDVGLERVFYQGVDEGMSVVDGKHHVGYWRRK